MDSIIELLPDPPCEVLNRRETYFIYVIQILVIQPIDHRLNHPFKVSKVDYPPSLRIDLASHVHDQPV